MLPNTWNSPDNKITKQIIKTGRLGLKPTENCKCCINITDCDSALSTLSPINFYTIGDSDSQVQRLLDNCLMAMHVEEIAQITFNLESKLTFKLELVNFETEYMIYEWNAQKKLDIALKHKTRGIELFQESRYTDASCRFGKALKILCSIPIEIDPSYSDIDGVSLKEIQNLKTNLYNNLASCYLKCQQYETVSSLCQKIFESDKSNVKALYKYAVAMCELHDYEKSQQTLMTLLKLDPENKAGAAKLKLVNVKVAESNVKLNSIIKKMFNN